MWRGIATTYKTIRLSIKTIADHFIGSLTRTFSIKTKPTTLVMNIHNHQLKKYFPSRLTNLNRCNSGMVNFTIVCTVQQQRKQCLPFTNTRGNFLFSCCNLIVSL